MHLVDAEEEVLGFNHTELAGHLLKSWSFLKTSARTPAAPVYSRPSRNAQGMAHMICLANFVIANVGLNYGREAWSIFGEQDALQYFEISEDEMQELILMAHDTIQEVKELADSESEGACS